MKRTLRIVYWFREISMSATEPVSIVVLVAPVLRFSVGSQKPSSERVASLCGAKRTATLCGVEHCPVKYSSAI